MSDRERDRSAEALPRSLAHLIKWAEMRVRSRLDAALRPFRLSSGQLLLLVTLDDLGQETRAGIARLLHLKPQSVTVLVRPLLERGLVGERLDEANRRRAIVELTPAGRDLLAEVRKVTPAVEDNITGRLDEEDKQRLRAILLKIV
jgi:DNA-binding MarR family transcriptional regulator